MNYIEVKFNCNPNNEIVNSILSAELGEIGFESFVEDEKGLTDYVQEEAFNKKNIYSIIDNFTIDAKLSYTYKLIEDRDWNEEWEKNYFKPLIIDDKCIIQSTFHNIPPTYEYNILITLKWRSAQVIIKLQS